MRVEAHRQYPQCLALWRLHGDRKWHRWIIDRWVKVWIINDPRCVCADNESGFISCSLRQKLTLLREMLAGCGAGTCQVQTHTHTHTCINKCSTIIFFKSAHRRFSSRQIIVFVMAYETKHRCIKGTNTLPLHIPIRHASAHLPLTAFDEHVTWSRCSFTNSSVLFMTFGSLMCVFFHNARLK